MTTDIVVTRDGQAQLRAWAADIEDVLMRVQCDREDATTLEAVINGLREAAGDDRADWELVADYVTKP